MSNGFVETDTCYGRMRGVRFRGVDSYLGIEYGASTAGQGRFAPPRRPECWSGVREAMAFGDAAPQVDTRTVAGNASQEVHNLMYVKGGHPLDGARMSEDCLNLNVWTPSSTDGGSRPVMVWLHGGGFVHGSAGSALYSGDQLAALGDVVVVTVNARLGLHGYLALDMIDDAFEGASNAGMLDIVAALEWVRDNIAHFGGDAGNVTVFGQSGGGGKVNTLMVMPAARGLFHKAINMSGPFLAVSERPAAAELADQVLAHLGLSRASAHRMNDLPMRQLLDAQASLQPTFGGGFGMAASRSSTGAIPIGYGPVLDGTHVTAQPFVGAAAETADGIPFLVGSTSHDPALLMAGHPDFATLTDDRARRLAGIHFGDSGVEAYASYSESCPEEHPRLRYARVVGDHTFRKAGIAMAELKSRQSAPVYVYEFAHMTDVVDTLIGAGHSVDLPYAFYNVDRSPFAGSLPTRHATSRAMALAWAAFARTGKPAHAEIPEWPRFCPDSRHVMRIAPEWQVFEQPRL